MLDYIKRLEKKLINENDIEKKKIIEGLLISEKDSCKRILNEYYQREETLGIKCEKVCEHEKEIIKAIKIILLNNV